MESKLRKFVVEVLRRASFKWKPKSAAKQAAREQVGAHSTGRAKYEYRCRHCGDLFKSKDVQVDHIDPVVPLDGFESGLEFDLNEYVLRLYCEKDGFQVLCKPCHSKKSKKENVIRRKNKVLKEDEY